MDAPREGSESTSRKRKRSRPSDWWIAGNLPSPVVFDDTGRAPLQTARAMDAVLAESSAAGNQRKMPKSTSEGPGAAGKNLGHNRQSDTLRGSQASVTSTREPVRKGRRILQSDVARGFHSPNASSSTSKANKRGNPPSANTSRGSLPGTSLVDPRGLHQPSHATPKRKPQARAPARLEASQQSKRQRIGGMQLGNEGKPVEGHKPLYYQHIVAVTRQVPHNTIEAKWGPLPHGCIERIAQLLQEIHRPLVLGHGDDRRRTEASTAMQVVARRLVSKISKGLPFPPSTRGQREDDFDFERILDHTRDLEASLTPASHSNELLQAQAYKESASLESETAILEELEVNAKAEASKRKLVGRKMHLLLQSHDFKTASDEQIADIGLRAKRSPPLRTQSVSLPAALRLS